MRTFIHFILIVLLALLMTVGTFDWLSGCGESWVQADGTRLAGECMGREFVFNLFK